MKNPQGSGGTYSNIESDANLQYCCIQRGYEGTIGLAVRVGVLPYGSQPGLPLTDEKEKLSEIICGLNERLRTNLTKMEKVLE